MLLDPVAAKATVWVILYVPGDGLAEGGTITVPFISFPTVLLMPVVRFPIISEAFVGVVPIKNDESIANKHASIVFNCFIWVSRSG